MGGLFPALASDDPPAPKTDVHVGDIRVALDDDSVRLPLVELYQWAITRPTASAQQADATAEFTDSDSKQHVLNAAQARELVATVHSARYGA
jgi:hypothetical protein